MVVWSTMIFVNNFLLYGFTAILGILIVIKFLYNVKYYRRDRLVDKLPGPPTIFLFGNSLSFIGKREDLFRKGITLMKPYWKYPLTRVWFGPFPIISVHDANILEAYLSSPKLIDKASIYKFVEPWLGLGLLTSTGKKWQMRRKMITPTFHFSILGEFLPIILEQAEMLVSILKQFDGKAAFDIYPYFARCTLDIICETAMGRSVAAQNNTDSEYVKAVNSLAEIINARVISPWLAPDFIFNCTTLGRRQKKCLRILHGFTDQVIAEKRKEFLEKNETLDDSMNANEIMGKKRRLAFLDMLLRSTVDGKSLSNVDIREEVDTFMFEGHDTTSSGLNWTIYNIGRFPEIQNKLHEEIDRVFGDSDRPITSEDLKELKFLECVIKETMRLFPPVPFFGRRTKEELNICGYTIPAGVDISFEPYSLHRNPEHFPDPDTFDPDRFLPENSAKRHPYSYLPFSAGSRNCIGQKFAMMEEKIIITQILRKFKVTSKKKLEDMIMVSELIFRPVDGMWIDIESRS